MKIHCRYRYLIDDDNNSYWILDLKMIFDGNSFWEIQLLEIVSYFAIFISWNFDELFGDSIIDINTNL